MELCLPCTLLRLVSNALTGTSLTFNSIQMNGKKVFSHCESELKTKIGKRELREGVRGGEIHETHFEGCPKELSLMGSFL